MTKETYGSTIEGEALTWPPLSAAELERFWVQREQATVALGAAAHLREAR